MAGVYSTSAMADPAARLTHRRASADSRRDRSEEHTSELQSPCNLVCRLLLAKKPHTTCIDLVRARLSASPRSRSYPRLTASAPRCYWGSFMDAVNHSVLILRAMPQSLNSWT